MKQTPLLEFESSAFAVIPGEDEEVSSLRRPSMVFAKWHDSCPVDRVAPRSERQRPVVNSR